MKVVTGEEDADATDSTAFDDMDFDNPVTALPSAGGAPSPGPPYPDPSKQTRLLPGARPCCACTGRDTRGDLPDTALSQTGRREAARRLAPSTRRPRIGARLSRDSLFIRVANMAGYR